MHGEVFETETLVGEGCYVAVVVGFRFSACGVSGFCSSFLFLSVLVFFFLPWREGW